MEQQALGAERLETVVARRFTTRGKNPLESVDWTTRASRITGADGSVVFEAEGIEVPEGWSQLATDILASKYLRRAGVPRPDGSLGGEWSLRQVVDRIVGALARAGARMGYFAEGEAETFADELAYLLVHQMAAFNSPVWFNCGLAEAYGIRGGGGNWAYQGADVAPQPDAYARPQASACFIQRVEDTLVDDGGVFDLMRSEARLFKYGSGSGTNFSSLRSRHEALSGGGTSSGVMAFLRALDAAAGATKSGGTTRRAAKMVCLDADHPEVEEFVAWKVQEERKAQALVSAGYEGGMDGEAYATVSGQNANTAVRVPDDLVRAALDDATWETVRPTNGRTHAVLSARRLWESVADAAWTCADPGIQFSSTIDRWHTCKASGPIRASNPCSEFLFLDDSACNLASINLLRFLRDDGALDVPGLRHAVRVLVTAQDILVTHGSYPTRDIARNSERFRPLGLGYANLGATLMHLGSPYDSREGRALAAAATALLTGHAYRVSAELAGRLGPFAGLVDVDGDGRSNQDHMTRVLQMHRDAARRLRRTGSPVEGLEPDGEAPPDDALARLIDDALEDWDAALDLGRASGWRNAQVSVLAPTGTIGLLMDCDTTGVEPDFSLVKFKKLSGGGSLRIPNQSLRPALLRLGHDAEAVECFLTHVEEHGTLEGSGLPEEQLPVFDCASAGSGTRAIAPEGHVRMLAAVQPFLSGGISKTVNLHAEATPDEVRGVFELAWRLGVKCVTVYRDGSKSGQPLSATGGKQPAVKQEEAGPAWGALVRPPPDNDLGFKRTVTVFTPHGPEKVDIQVWEYPDGAPCEVFVGARKTGTLTDSFLKEVGKSYSRMLQLGMGLDDLSRKLMNEHGPLAGQTDHRYLKRCLGIQDLIAKLLRYEYFQETSFLSVQPDPEDPSYQPTRREVLERLGHALGRPTGERRLDEFGSGVDEADRLLEGLGGDAPACDQCGHTTVLNGACYKCLNCGNSMGCS